MITLSGFTPTGRLHLGHYVGAVRPAIQQQLKADRSVFLIANVHALTTRAQDVDGIRKDTFDLARDLIACGLDLSISHLVIQSMVPEIAELTFYLSMLVPYNKVMRNPTINDEINVKGLGDQYPFGFPLYAIGQCADILIFKAEEILVGEDQTPLVDLCRDVASKFNDIYCGVSTQADESKAVELGGTFPIPRAKITSNARLPGIDGKQKMSKSLGNAIYLHESAEEVHRKVMKIFTGRQAKDEPGDINNALMKYVRCFLGETRARIVEERYIHGDNIGDGEIKEELAYEINKMLDPIRERMKMQPKLDDHTMECIFDKEVISARSMAAETMAKVRKQMKMFF